MQDAFIFDAVCAPIGRYGGTLSAVRADDLSAIPLAGLVRRNPGMAAEDMAARAIRSGDCKVMLAMPREPVLPDDASHANPEMAVPSPWVIRWV